MVLTPKFPTIGPLLSVLHPVAPITILPERPVGVVPINNPPVVCPSAITIPPVVILLNKLARLLVVSVIILAVLPAPIFNSPQEIDPVAQCFPLLLYYRHI
jgi:hypothetical protein